MFVPNFIPSSSSLSRTTRNVVIQGCSEFSDRWCLRISHRITASDSLGFAIGVASAKSPWLEGIQPSRWPGTFLENVTAEPRKLSSAVLVYCYQVSIEMPNSGCIKSCKITGLSSSLTWFDRFQPSRIGCDSMWFCHFGCDSWPSWSIKNVLACPCLKPWTLDWNEHAAAAVKHCWQHPVRMSLTLVLVLFSGEPWPITLRSCQKPLVWPSGMKAKSAPITQSCGPFNFQVWLKSMRLDKLRLVLSLWHCKQGFPLQHYPNSGFSSCTQAPASDCRVADIWTSEHGSLVVTCCRKRSLEDGDAWPDQRAKTGKTCVRALAKVTKHWEQTRCFKVFRPYTHDLI